MKSLVFYGPKEPLSITSTESTPPSIAFAKLSAIRQAVRDSSKPWPVAAIASSLPSNSSPPSECTERDRLVDPIVDRIDSPADASTAHAANPSQPDPQPRMRILSTPEDLPKTSFPVVQTLFVLFQLMYLGFYIGALANLAEIDGLVSPLPSSALVFRFIFVIGCHPHSRARLHSLRRTVPRAGIPRKIPHPLAISTLFDELWSLSPFLLLHHINFGVALACTTLLVYSPFAQRSIVLMGAGGAPLLN